MAASHSFTGEDIEDRGGEKAGADYDHHDIEHGESPLRAFQIAASNRQRRLCEKPLKRKTMPLPRIQPSSGARRGAEAEPGSTDRTKCIVRR
jgi:hypothetical protein